MERVATGVKEKRHLIVADVEIKLIVGVLGVDGRALAEVAAEAVDNGILGFESGEIGMGEDFAAGGAVDHEGAVHIEDFLPLDLIDLVVEFLLVVGLEFGKGFEDCQCGAAGIVGPVEGGHSAFEGDSTVDALHILGTEGAEFVGQHLFEAHHGFGDHLEFVTARGDRHYFAILFLNNHWEVY